MKKRVSLPAMRRATWIQAGVILISAVSTAIAQEDVFKVASWLVGSFESRARGEAGSAVSPSKREFMVARVVQDPVVFTDALYLYVEHRIDDAAIPSRQRVFRLKKSGRRVRLEVFRIDPQILAPLASDPQMLTQLSPGDLSKEAGCDILLEAQGDAYAGASDPRSCKSDWQGSVYVNTSIRITKDLIVTLERGYDENGVQTFGPTDGRGYEFRRVAPDSLINLISPSV